MEATTPPARAPLRRFVERLPRGRSLPPEVWQRRHSWMTLLVWSQAVGLVVYGLIAGHSIGHSALEGVPVAGCALAAGATALPRRVRTGAVAIGLLTASAILVHLMEGRIEAHFHFFVMVTILSTYEEWFPYLLGVAYVVLHHGLAGVIEPSSVYDHAAAIEDPWKWAGVHALFIGALGAANIVGWRLNEEVRYKMRRSEERFRMAFDDAPIGMALIDRKGRFLRVNRRLGELTGYDPDAMLAFSLDQLDAYEERWRPGEEAGEHERHFRRSDDTTGWCLWQWTLVEEGEETYYVCHFLDVTRRKQAETELSYQAHHDSLTGLPNRTQFARRLGAALEGGAGLAVAFVDIDDFKVINDSLGHGAGDRLLGVVAERLRRVLRPGDLLARFGGDEFTALLEGVKDSAHALRVAERLAGALRAPFELDGEQRFITASVGVTVSGPGPGRSDAEELLRDADAAMYRAKELGKARCELFDQSMRSRAVERLELEAGLRNALEREELKLHYQPAVELESGRVVSLEALLRWEHPERGLLLPLRFIPLAEQTGLIVPIGEWVIQEACRQLAAWDAPELTVAVNVSPRQLASERLVTAVSEALDAAGLEPDRLCLEITESAVIADPDAALGQLHGLKAIGVRLAVDDFGIGYSSLANLRELLPVDILKIDKSFVDGLNASGDDRAIVESVVSLARSLGLEAIAEGVETAAQAEALTLMECSHAQGYHYAKPQPASAVTQLLRADALGELAG
jgi:diguanylate cyclase (GGDEF)-like protein/PAS domain S-box-containing protein